eukprot:scaffold10416_cov32-Tisochrysis_lutea.AAC.3
MDHAPVQCVSHRAYRTGASCERGLQAHSAPLDPSGDILCLVADAVGLGWGECAAAGGDLPLVEDGEHLVELLRHRLHLLLLRHLVEEGAEGVELRWTVHCAEGERAGGRADAAHKAQEQGKKTRRLL